MHIGSRSGSGTCFVAFRGCAERRNFSHIESRGNKVSEMAHGAVPCSTACLLSSRCATRGFLPAKTEGVPVVDHHKECPSQRTLLPVELQARSRVIPRVEIG